MGNWQKEGRLVYLVSYSPLIYNTHNYFPHLTRMSKMRRCIDYEPRIVYLILWVRLAYELEIWVIGWVWNLWHQCCWKTIWMCRVCTNWGESPKQPVSLAGETRPFRCIGPTAILALGSHLTSAGRSMSLSPPPRSMSHCIIDLACKSHLGKKSIIKINEG